MSLMERLSEKVLQLKTWPTPPHPLPLHGHERRADIASHALIIHTNYLVYSVMHYKKCPLCSVMHHKKRLLYKTCLLFSVIYEKRFYCFLSFITRGVCSVQSCIREGVRRPTVMHQNERVCFICSTFL
jgi:hypothetical protein